MARKEHLKRLRLSSGELMVVSTGGWNYFLWESEKMCCGQEQRVEAEWWQYVRAGAVLTSFASEADALAFLENGYDNTPPGLQETWAALQFKKEQAGK